MTSDPKFETASKVLLIILVISFLITLSGRLIPLFVWDEPGVLATVSYTVKFFAGIWALLGAIVNIAIGVWLWRRSKLDNRSQYTWLGLGVFGGVWAAAFYLLIPIYESLVVERKSTKQDETLKP